MRHPILYCHPESGYSYKVGLALSLLAIDFEQRHVAIRKPRAPDGVAWADAAGIGLARWPRVLEWLGRMAELPGFQTPRRLFAGHEAVY